MHNTVINDDLSSVTTRDDGKELRLSPRNPETQKPFASAAAVTAFVAHAAGNENYWSMPAVVAGSALQAAVIAERERRLALGFDYDFGDARGIHRIATAPDDMEKWITEVTPYANALVATGDTATAIDILTETGAVQVTGLEWQAVLVAAGHFRQPIYAASFALLAADPIPSDFTDDGYWP